MHICIDSRLYGLKHAGIGRYIQNLIDQLGQIDTQNQYTLLVSNDANLKKLPRNFTLISTAIGHYTLAEQTKLIRVLNNIDADLFHFPHFNVPFLFKKPYVLTVHDLLWHDKIGFNVTTLHPVKYVIKYVGYRLVIKNAINKAKKIITPTKVVKTAVSHRFNRNPTDITVTYEAADRLFSQPIKTSSDDLDKYGLSQPFVIYTGSLYPHKNVINVVRALDSLPDVTLAIASARNVFVDRFMSQVNSEKLTTKIKLLGFVPDSDLITLYAQALCLVLPSQSEGFGLTGLEAITTGLPVVCTDSPVLREIYQDAALYVDTKQPKAISNKIKLLLDRPKTRKQLQHRAKQVAHQYSWKQMAQQTLAVYHQALV